MATPGHVLIVIVPSSGCFLPSHASLFNAFRVSVVSELVLCGAGNSMVDKLLGIRGVCAAPGMSGPG